MFIKSYQKVLSWSRHPKAGSYLAAVSFADSSLFPVSPVVMIVPMSLAAPTKAFRWAWIASFFSLLGGCLGYALGYWAFQPLLLPLIHYFGYTSAYQSALHAFSAWGYWALFFAAFVPIPYKFFTIGAGVLSLNLPLFLVSSGAGRGLRFFTIGTLIRYGGPKIGAWFRRYRDKQAASIRNN